MAGYVVIANYYTEKQVSKLTGIPRKSLQRYRKNGEGPPWIRFGRRTIRYPIGKFKAWIEDNMENNHE